MKLNELTEQIIAASIEVHKSLGAGLLESAYEQCLCKELSLRGLKFTLQQALPVDYKGVHLDCGYRLDILVEDKVVVEIKSVKTLSALHEAQLLTYLRLGGWQVGLLINFNTVLLKNGIKRKVLNYKDD